MLLLAPIPSSTLQKMSRVSVIRSFYALRPRWYSPINTVIPFNFTCFDKGKLSRFSVMAVPSASSSSSIPGLSIVSTNSRASKKKARREAPESVLKHKLDMCSKNNDLMEALRLYDDARVNGTPLALHHYNVLLYLCSSSSSSASSVVEGSEECCSLVKSNGNEANLGLERGFEIFKQMDIDKISPNEATFTNLARLALAKDDPEMAFELVKKMNTCGILPRLRSYGPALFGFSKRGDADRAYEVDSHMAECGVVPEEPELCALLKVSVDVKRDDKVYEVLHRLRTDVRQVTEDTARVMAEWFVSEAGGEVGMENHDVGKVKDAVIKGGGGWHGQGWLGSGKWRVVRTELNKTGVCRSCGEQLVSIDIDPKETETFATSLANLACQRALKTNTSIISSSWVFSCNHKSMACSMFTGTDQLTLIRSINKNAFGPNPIGSDFNCKKLVSRVGFVPNGVVGRNLRSKTLIPKCSMSAPRPISQLRFIQHKKEAFWFYRFLSIVYDHIINPGHWTEDMREDALEPADLSDRSLVVVDVGGGTGFTTLGIVEHVDPKNVTILDQSPHQLAKAKEKEPLKDCKIMLGDAEDLPFPTDYADRYVSAGSIEYWPDPQRGIKEAYRVVKQGGKACLIGPVHPTFWLSRFFADVWMLFPKEEEYIDWFRKAGFEDVQLKRIGPKWYRGVRRHGLIMGCSVTGVKPASGDSPLELGPKAEDISKPVNPITFLVRLLLGAMAATYYVLVPIYMWIKDQAVPKDQPI